ncbi:MAG: zinc ribbon domain-containing protein [Clostridia bacterium]
MKGRYGIDKLTIFLVILAIVISIIGMFLNANASVARWIITGVSTLLVVLCIFRMMSKNFQKRQRELHIYNELTYKLKAFFTGFPGSIKRDVKERQSFKRFSCPQCGQKLRVPRGKGRLRVTCTKCGCKFEAKS